MKYLSDPNKKYARLVPREEEWLLFIEKYYTDATSRDEMIYLYTRGEAFYRKSCTVIEASMAEMDRLLQKHAKEMKNLLGKAMKTTCPDGNAYISHVARSWLARKAHKEMQR